MASSSFESWISHVPFSEIVVRSEAREYSGEAKTGSAKKIEMRSRRFLMRCAKQFVNYSQFVQFYGPRVKARRPVELGTWAESLGAW